MNEAPNRGARSVSRVRSASLIVAGRAVLLFVAAGAAVFALFLTRVDGRSASSSQNRYSCSMHPDVSADVPGNCPICGMALRQVSESGVASSRAAEALVRGQAGLVDVAKRRVFTHELRAAAWVRREGVVQALLYHDEIQTLAPGERGAFHPTGTPAMSYDVRFGAGPAVAWDRSTSMIDFQVEGGGPQLEVGAAGWLDLGAKARSALVVPSASVIQYSEGTYVLTASANGRTFTRRPVHIGRTFFGLTAIVDGLYEKERVAARSAFFLDAEERLRAELGATAAVKP